MSIELARANRRLTTLPAAPDLRALRAAEDRATPERPTIAALIEQYLVWKAGTASRHTIRNYRDGLRHFAGFLAASGIDMFADNCDALPASILEQNIIWLRQCLTAGLVARWRLQP